MATYDFDGVEFDCGESPICNMLARLCEAQRVALAKLVAERDSLTATLTTTANQLIEEGRRRRDALVRLGEDIADKQDDVRRLAAQRDVVERCLRSLMMHLANQPITSLTYFGGEAFGRAVRDAKELLTLVDQAKSLPPVPTS